MLRLSVKEGSWTVVKQAKSGTLKRPCSREEF
jgi:hypothetical protein